jgi:3-oxoacyl-[acyl-carrier-protein] synthase II
LSLTDVREPIAIIGMGCRFPGASNPRAFWELLQEGGDAVREIPADRWDASVFHEPDPVTPEMTSSRNAGLIDSVDGFDWRAFRIPPREARYMDPQHRLLLEVAWEALEDAGLPFEEVAGSRTGVYIAIMWNDYLRLQSRDASRINGYSATGNGFAFAANRISYAFDLRGPSVAMDCACAGSLASLHAACQSLWLGETTMALAGGVNLILSPDVNIMLTKAGVLSSEGRCMTLDARADGFVRGEGAGVVVLKPYSQVNASDRVYGLVRGSAVSHNGHNEWIMAASPAGQEMALTDAYRAAGVDPAAVDYVELHGTGLPKGDPIEANVLGKVVGTRPGRKHPCAIGSVKSNIGHLDSAAGIAGVIKVALAFQNERIPPTIHLEEVNPDIHLEELGLTAQRALGSWPSSTRPPLAGVTAISMSGVNAHVVLEGPDTRIRTQTERPWVEGALVLPLSAPSPEALLSLVNALRHQLTDDDRGGDSSLRDICFTAGVRRSHHAHRLALVVGPQSLLVDTLQNVLVGQPGSGVFSSESPPDEEDIRPELIEVIGRCLRTRDSAGTVIPSSVGEDQEPSLLLEALGVLYVRGHAVDWQALYPSGGRCVDFPTTPWMRERLWLDWLDTPDRALRVESEGQPGHAPALAQLLSEAPTNERWDLLHAHVRARIAGVLGIDQPHLLKPQQGFFDIGMNSLSAVELVSALQIDVGQSLPATLAFEYPSIDELTGYLATQVLFLDNPLPSRAEEQQDNDGQHDAMVSRLEQLSDEEAEAQLLAKLRGLRNE